MVQKYARNGSVNVDGVLDELFLMTLNRRPTSDERAKLKAIQQKGAVLKAETPKKAEPAPKVTKPPEPKQPKGTKPKGPRQRPTQPPAPTMPGVVMPTSSAETSQSFRLNMK